MKNVKRLLLSTLIVASLYVPMNVYALDNQATYKVQSGEALWTISNKLGVSIDYLRIVNNLSSDMLLNGQLLKLTPDTHTYTVKSGDSLWKISIANNVSVNDLKALNNLTTESLNVGQVIKFMPDTITYAVKRGDTLYLLSKTFGTTVTDIKKINNLTADYVNVGQNLLIPYKAQPIKTSAVVAVSPTTAKPPTTTTGNSSTTTTTTVPVVTAVTPTPVKNFPSITYIVQAGDTPATIGKKFNVSAQDIMKYNYMGINDWLNIGQKIAINGYAPRDYAVVPGMDKAPTQYGHLVDWFRDGQYILKRNEVLTIVDFATRKQFTVKVMGGYNHADVEPISPQDTAIMKALFGTWDWTPRPVIIYKNGMNIAASLSGMPHSFDTISTNGVSGHFDVYLKNSIPHKTYTSQTYIQEHYSSILISSGQVK